VAIVVGICEGLDFNQGRRSVEQEQEGIEPLKYQLKQWRKLVRYLPPTDSDRDDVDEIEKLIKQGIGAQPAEQAAKCGQCDWLLKMTGDKFCGNCGRQL